jgi:tRNA(fMet)-specific endonuclease VapC
MVVLDTDHVSLLEWESPETQRLRRRRAELPPDDVATTIISYEEQTRGWLAYATRAKSVAEEVQAYGKLYRHLQTYRTIKALEFTDLAAVELQRLPRSRIRVGTMDLQIAAVAFSCRATILSRNLRDFAQVPGLKVENWTR